ncbi:hypothetical protein [Pleionea sp. CnH1-48]|uniref:hypothetical protein n=1 Tax=Pleionea sp. CnH1-48 TaxID=2954494 RepID=UPI0020971AD9|nr:hypothetical protein [Pleionea sp. CnH1-48]MCO7225950.1 hypothetical protein [Pleionea sp. CnH1-48]
MTKNKKFTIPESDSPFLSGILSSIEKRRKSLRYNSWSMSLERVVEVYEEGKLEKLEFKIQPSSHNAWLEASLWEDRFITVNCWERTKQNKWDWYHEGNLLPLFEPKSVIEAIENTRNGFKLMGDRSEPNFSSIWGSMLASGLKLV